MKVLEFFDSEKKWHHGSQDAKDKNGKGVVWGSKEAVTWSLAGGIWKVNEGDMVLNKEIQAKLEKVAKTRFGIQGFDIWKFNCMPTTIFIDILDLLTIANV